MSYDNMSSVSQNVLKFYQQLTGEERRVPFIFGRNNRNVLVMEIGWTDVGSRGYILNICWKFSSVLYLTKWGFRTKYSNNVYRFVAKKKED
jgi:hypothetical protein